MTSFTFYADILKLIYHLYGSKDHRDQRELNFQIIMKMGDAVREGFFFLSFWYC